MRTMGGDGVYEHAHGDKSSVDSLGVKTRTRLSSDLVELGRRLYYEKGPSYTIWWFLREIWVRRRHPVKLEDIFRFHQAIAGVRSKNATVKALKRLELYGLVKSLGDGWYRPEVLDEGLASGSIDFSRVRTRDQVLSKKRELSSLLDKSEELPRPVQEVVDKARELIERGERWRAIDLLAHTLLPIRESGILIARLGDMFLYFEQKTGKMHMLRSERLAQVFDELGIPSGPLALHRTQEATSIIRRMFGSHDNARRIHYLLKELGWFQEVEGHYFWRLWEDPVSGTSYISIYRKTSGDLEEVARVPPSAPEGLYASTRGGAIVTREHVKEENEDSYFVRIKGWL